MKCKSNDNQKRFHRGYPFRASRPFRALLLLAISLCFFVPGLNAEIVQLKGGAQIKGKILKRTEKVLILDLGYDVIRIPASEVAKILKDKQDQKNKGKQSPTLSRVNKKGIKYTAGELKESTTAERVSQFAPAVVLVRSPGGLGSGFFVNKEGYLVTNFHVIQGEKHISVTRYNKSGAELKRIIHKKVRIVALDPFHDLAVLQLQEPLEKDFRPVILTVGSEPAMGERIFVVGNPLGLERTVSEGVVSHTGRNFFGKLFLQIDASVNPGNSGGPLFNSRGQVIGVINMGARRMQGLNFAIPIHHVKYLLEHIDSYTYDESSPLSGYVYSSPPSNPSKRKMKEKPAPGQK